MDLSKERGKPEGFEISQLNSFGRTGICPVRGENMRGKLALLLWGGSAIAIRGCDHEHTLGPLPFRRHDRQNPA